MRFKGVVRYSISVEDSGLSTLIDRRFYLIAEESILDYLKIQRENGAKHRSHAIKKIIYIFNNYFVPKWYINTQCKYINYIVYTHVNLLLTMPLIRRNNRLQIASIIFSYECYVLRAHHFTRSSVSRTPYALYDAIAASYA